MSALIVSQEPGIKFSGTHLLEGVSFSTTAKPVSTLKSVMSTLSFIQTHSQEVKLAVKEKIIPLIGLHSNIRSNNPTISICH